MGPMLRHPRGLGEEGGGRRRAQRTPWVLRALPRRSPITSPTGAQLASPTSTPRTTTSTPSPASATTVSSGGNLPGRTTTIRRSGWRNSCSSPRCEPPPCQLILWPWGPYWLVLGCQFLALFLLGLPPLTHSMIISDT